MPRVVCSRDQKPAKAKMANAYVSWYAAEDQRICFYTSWCIGHFTDDILPLIQHASAPEFENGTICLLCGAEINGEPGLVFMNLYLPKREMVQFEFQACPEVCWPQLRENLASGGRLRPDRNARVGAGSQAPTPLEAAWAGIDVG